MSYWKQQLADLTPLQLPVDFAATAEPARAAGVHAFQIDRELTGLVEKLARPEGATTFMVLLSALQAVLARWCAQSEIVLGMDVANRDQIETEGLIGFFINSTLLRPIYLAIQRRRKSYIARARRCWRRTAISICPL